MAKFKRHEVYQKVYETGLMPLFYESDINKAKMLLKACYDGGARTVEMTNRGDFAHEVYAELMKFSRKELPDLALGVGTIVDTGTLAMYLQMGADFVVTPMMHEDVARVCNRRQIGWFAGCATLTEISKAQELGAEIVKIFPGDGLGPNFIKGALGPMPWSRLMPTGGVEPTYESLKSWFESGVVAVGMGSKLFPKGAKPEEIEEKVRFCIDTIKGLK
jgi:2-dehydro-3-deoxyphosphogluconate aldolase / (4S)-4-hydroxy-2-oxoglutarate aldolase